MNKIEINWGTVFKYGFILFAIAVVCTLLLAVTNMITAPVIAERDEEKNIEAQQSVLPEADQFIPIPDLDKVIAEMPENGDLVESIDYAYSGVDLVGFTVKTNPNGYGGEIQLLTGIDVDGTISGIYVLDQSETAGLGARSTEEEFQNEFKGLSADEEITVEKTGQVEGNEIQAISGATITSNAVTLGVNTSSEAANIAAQLGGVEK